MEDYSPTIALSDVCILRLNILVNKISVMSKRSHRFLGITSSVRGEGGGKCVFAQGHNTAEVGIEPRPLDLESRALQLGHHAPCYQTTKI